jgi:SHS2 domain-containing protein
MAKVLVAATATATATSAKIPRAYRPDEARLTVEATSLAELFTGAARAMSEQLGEGVFTPGPDEAHQVSIDADNPDALLSAWLSEILFHSRQAGRLFGAARLHRITSRHLRAELRADQGTRWFVDASATRIVEARVENHGRRLIARVALQLAPLAMKR